MRKTQERREQIMLAVSHRVLRKLNKNSYPHVYIEIKVFQRLKSLEGAGDEIHL